MDPTRKGTATPAGVVTEGAAQAALRRGPARELSPAEDQVMRMRLGAALPRTAELEWLGAGLDEDLRVELLAMQLEAWMKWKAHLAAHRAAARAPEARTLPAAQPSRAKEKIVRSLRKKA